MSQKDSMNDKMATIYCSKEIDSKIAASISYQILEKYYGSIFVNYVNNGFSEQYLPSDLWTYSSVAMIGISPNEMGMRTIRSMVHDRNILWIDNQLRNIPMWTEYYMIPGERNTEYSLTEMCWSYFHEEHKPPKILRLLCGKHSVIEMSKML